MVSVKLWPMDWDQNFCSINSFHPSFPSPLSSAMGRRAKNKQGDPLPLHADPDLNGSSKALELKSKPGLKDRSSASNLHPKLGKRKAERDNDGERATKKPKGPLSAGKSRPQAKAAPAKKPVAKAAGKPTKSNWKKVDLEDGVIDDDGSVGWDDVKDVDMQAMARCVCPSEDASASPNLRVICRRSLFRDSDTSDEERDAEEFTGFTGGLEDLESDEDEAEEYVSLFPFLPRCL